MPNRPRARDIGLTLGTLPTGPHNALTDVPGVRVGHVTLIEGEGPLVPGVGPIRTGVTAIHPHAGDVFREKVPACVHALNGFGEVTNSEMIKETGVLESPIVLTGTTSVPRVADGVLDWCFARDPELGLSVWTPAVVVAECSDQFMNDMRGRHVRSEHVAAALDGASTGPIIEGGVGGGTGMICYGFKGGVGTASRRLPAPLSAYTVGALVQANHGVREELRIDGVAVGEAIADLRPEPDEAVQPAANSILMVLATDAPLLDVDCARLARRAVHGLAKTGSISSNGSGDFALAFSTANRIPRHAFWQGDPYTLSSLEQFHMNPLLQAAAEAVEEAIVNALFAATTMVGRDGHVVHALPLERVLGEMERSGRLFSSKREAVSTAWVGRRGTSSNDEGEVSRAGL